ncbi:hypothetical protein HU200_033880 [Digitaria exilis]|uniref:Uncharacterized protein n=1 Tax=Digitaria exilis TaxID=1010633 RepID=A0A835BKB9_9POAL|nr:hypothetical protein HU200_033880 [Digitaria exilis]
MTEWLMESLRKDANRGGSAPWETGSGKAVRGTHTHQTVAFDRAWWGACLMLRPCCCRNLRHSFWLPCETGQKSLKGFCLENVNFTELS